MLFIYSLITFKEKWKNNEKLFGCEYDYQNSLLKSLCSNTSTVGTIFYQNNINVFTSDKMYVFSGDPTSTSPLGDVVNDSIVPSTQWKGFHPILGGFFAMENILCVIMDNKYYSCWHPNGEPARQNVPIEEPDDGVEDDAGALIPLKNNKYGKITDGTNMCYFNIKGDVCYKDYCVPLSKDKNNFPPEIIAYIKTSNGSEYFIRIDATYCQRQLYHNNEV